MPCDDRIALRTHNDEIRGQVFTLRLAMFCRGLATQKDSAFSDVNCLLIFSSLGTMQGQVEVERRAGHSAIKKKITHFLKMFFFDKGVCLFIKDFRLCSKANEQKKRVRNFSMTRSWTNRRRAIIIYFGLFIDRLR